MQESMKMVYICTESTEAIFLFVCLLIFYCWFLLCKKSCFVYSQMQNKCRERQMNLCVQHIQPVLDAKGTCIASL